MTDMKSESKGSGGVDASPSVAGSGVNGPGHERPRGFLDPAWEEVLRRGQEAEGEIGGLDADLAMLRLVRHAREPESLDDDALATIWAGVESQVTPTPAWRRWMRSRWLLWMTPVAAAAAVALVVLEEAEESVDTAAVALRSEVTRVAAESAPAIGRESGRGSGFAAETAIAAVDEPSPASPTLSRARNRKRDLDQGDGGGGAFEAQFAMLELDARARLDAEIEGGRRMLRKDMMATAKRGGR